MAATSTLKMSEKRNDYQKCKFHLFFSLLHRNAQFMLIA